MVTALLGFAAASVLLVLLPGPDTLVVVRNMVRGGRRGAFATVLGILVGLTFWIAAACLGLAALVRASDAGYTALRLVGGAYLIYVGVQAVRLRHADTRGKHTARKHRPLLGSGFMAGLLADLLNPKVGVTFVTLLPAFIPAGAAVGTASLALGGVYVLESVLYFAVVILLADRVLGWMNSPRTRRRIDRAAGLVFIGFGVRLAVESG